MGAGNEFSISYQAVKSMVYKLIDAVVDGRKTEEQVRQSIARWWSLVHPLDRPVARKYLLMVLGKAENAMNAIGDEIKESSDDKIPAPRIRAAIADSLLSVTERSHRVDVPRKQ